MKQNFLIFFFFSSRRRHTRLQGDWSSDVCSSDLEVLGEGHGVQGLPDGGIIATESSRQAVPEEFQKRGRVAIDVPETAQPGAIPAREVGRYRHPARPPCSSKR